PSPSGSAGNSCASPRDAGRLAVMCIGGRIALEPRFMSWTGRGGRRSYHHGNLREALISAALDLIAQKGPAGFTFAEAARAAGVSPAAPYRHFRDRDALMADVALRGFQHFERRLAAAWDEGRPSPLTALERMGGAYLAFAREE